MELAVIRCDGSHRLEGDGEFVGYANRYLQHLWTRAFQPTTIRAYAYDLLNFGRFLTERNLAVSDVQPAHLFDYLDWQLSHRAGATRGHIVHIGARAVAASTMNRRIAAVRGFYSYAKTAGLIDNDPVPAGRRSSGFRAARHGLLSHLGPGRHRHGGRLVRQPQRLPESLDPDDVSAFLADLRTYRDRSIVLLMLLGGLRSAEVRTLRLADVDMALSQVRVVGKGDKERVVPVDDVFFRECAAYLQRERPKGCRTPECFVVLRGPTTGRAMTEAGLRSIFRAHRLSSGAARVRPHRLRHTYGTELAAAGVDLLSLRELMGHSSPETTASYVHLSAASLAREYAAARKVIDQ